MKTKDTIQFKGNSYTVRSTYHKGAGYEVIIGSRSLLEAMEEFGFSDKEVVAVDETIYAYADDNVIETFTNKEFGKYINQNYD